MLCAGNPDHHTQLSSIDAAKRWSGIISPVATHIVMTVGHAISARRRFIS
jgi:hypothetical protein